MSITVAGETVNTIVQSQKELGIKTPCQLLLENMPYILFLYAESFPTFQTGGLEGISSVHHKENVINRFKGPVRSRSTNSSV